MTGQPNNIHIDLAIRFDTFRKRIRNASFAKGIIIG